jgi:hypothetical protein
LTHLFGFRCLRKRKGGRRLGWDRRGRKRRRRERGRRDRGRAGGRVFPFAIAIVAVLRGVKHECLSHLDNLKRKERGLKLERRFS